MTSPIDSPSPPTRPAAAAPADERLSWAQTRALIRSDFARLVTHLEQGASLAHRAYFFLLPGMQALFWYRISRYCYLRGWVGLARFINLVAIYLTRAEIPPTTSIGPSALIAHATGVALFGRIGARFTIQGDGGCGGGFGTEDIGGGPGYAVIGDDVVLAHGAKVLGPVRIGDGVHVGPCALVTTDVPAGALVLWPRPRILLGGAVGAAGARPQEPAR
jgi:serine acetyltransferase